MKARNIKQRVILPIRYFASTNQSRLWKLKKGQMFVYMENTWMRSARRIKLLYNDWHEIAETEAKKIFPNSF